MRRAALGVAEDTHVRKEGVRAYFAVGRNVCKGIGCCCCFRDRWPCACTMIMRSLHLFFLGHPIVDVLRVQQQALSYA